MLETRVLTSIEQIGRDQWDRLFPGELERFDYLAAVEAAGLEGFRWRYVVVGEDGRLLAAAPAFLTEYALETTLNGGGRRLADGLRRLLPRVLTLDLGCLGSPCTETLTVGYAPEAPEQARLGLLRRLLSTFEEDAEREGCDLLGVKDVAALDRDAWDIAAKAAGYRPLPGLPVARLQIEFPDLDAYLAGLSPGARRDMRRKLRVADEVRIEIRSDLDGVLDRIMELYGQTRSRAEMQFETLTPAYFEGVVRRMPDRAFYVLYYVGDELLAANLLLEDDGVLLDKFFCMDAALGRRFNLYFLSWFTNVRLCLDRGLHTYQSGQAAYRNKVRLGSRLAPTVMYFRHRNRLLNGALQFVAPLLSADFAEDEAA